MAEIRHAAQHVPGLIKVIEAKARWLGHRLQADVAIEVAGDLRISDATRIVKAYQTELFAHLPALAAANIRVLPCSSANAESLRT
jgi:divalent metal cation (Fe/Co/Zn/Cd) transporter